MTVIPPQIASPCKEYEYTYEAFTKVNPNLKYPMAAYVFFEDNSLTKPKWANSAAYVLLQLRSNQAMYDVVINQERCSTLKFILDIRFLTFLSNPKKFRID